MFSPVRQGGKYALKCDNLSFFKVVLPQTFEPLGSANGYAPLIQHRKPCPVRDLLPNPNQRITRKPGLFDCTPYDLLKCAQVLHSFLPERRAAGQNLRILTKPQRFFRTGGVLSAVVALLGTIDLAIRTA